MPHKINPLPSQDYLLKVLDYSIITGNLFWKKNVGTKRIKGKIAGSLNKDNGYITVCLGGTKYRAHRIIWKMITGEDPVELVDHIDGDRSNNSWHNLREATVSENLRNARMSSKNSSGYKGVSFNSSRNRYEAYITIKRRHYYLGGYMTAEEAYAAYCAGANKHHGEFARYA
jgi:hypothetical protein